MYDIEFFYIVAALDGKHQPFQAIVHAFIVLYTLFKHLCIYSTVHLHGFLSYMRICIQHRIYSIIVL